MSYSSSPKVLDLIAYHLETGGQVDASSFVGESQLIAWWWQAEVQVGSKAHARAAALLKIAQRQADQMRVFIALDELSPSARDLVDELAHSRLLVVSGNRVNFAHDLYGDWVRQQVLLAHGIDLVLKSEERGRNQGRPRFCRRQFQPLRRDGDFLRTHLPPPQPFVVVLAGTRNFLRPTTSLLSQTFHERFGRIHCRNPGETRSPLSFAQSRATGYSL